MQQLDPSLQLTVVSPSPAARRLLQLLLRQLGHPCHSAEDADDALARVGNGRATVVLVDLRQSDEDALFLSALLQRRHPKVACIALHADALEVRTEDVQCSLPLTAFPSTSDLRDALATVTSGQHLRTFRPKVALA